MTDNDRAATYTGWKPGQRCEVRDSFIEDRSRNQARCSKCSWNVPLANTFQREHDIPAPLMDDPRNYVRALETVYQKYPQRRPGLLEVVAHTLFSGNVSYILDYLVSIYDAENP